MVIIAVANEELILTVPRTELGAFRSRHPVTHVACQGPGQNISAICGVQSVLGRICMRSLCFHRGPRICARRSMDGRNTENHKDRRMEAWKQVRKGARPSTPLYPYIIILALALALDALHPCTPRKCQNARKRWNVGWPSMV